MSKTAFVTGAGGFIGSHLVDMLLAQDWQVKALVRYTSTGTWGWLERYRSNQPKALTVVVGNVCDAEQMANEAAGCDTIFHLAALIGIPYSYSAPNSYVQTNVVGTLNMLQAARRHNVGRFVHTSTSEVYGSAIYTPIDEKHPLQGQSPYSASKIGADMLVESFFRSFDLPALIIRPFNTFGPRQSARAVIPMIISQALSKPVIKLGSLDPIRDLTYVTDTAAGFIAGANAPDEACGKVYNLGTGKAVSIGDLARTVFELLEGEFSIETDPGRVRPEKSEVKHLLSQNTRALDVLSWEPALDLAEGLSLTIDWMKEELLRYAAAVQGSYVQ